MLEEAREMVLEGLVTRFKVVPKDLEDTIRAIESRIQLKELLRAVIRSESLEEFRRRVLEIKSRDNLVGGGQVFLDNLLHFLSGLRLLLSV